MCLRPSEEGKVASSDMRSRTGSADCGSRRISQSGAEAGGLLNRSGGSRSEVAIAGGRSAGIPSVGSAGSHGGNSKERQCKEKSDLHEKSFAERSFAVNQNQKRNGCRRARAFREEDTGIPPGSEQSAGSASRSPRSEIPRL